MKISIVNINIKNYKCLKDINVQIDEKNDLSCFLGKNGTGKSNLLNAIKYFYDNMFSYYGKTDAIDNRNVYVQNMEISITYDLSNLLLKRTSKDYIQDMIKTLEPYLEDKKQIMVKMIQDKNGKIDWYPENKEVLKSIFSIFPMYHINTRDIDLVNWDMLWNIISDLSKGPSRTSEENFHKMLDETFIEAYGGKYEKNFKIIKNVLEAENVNLNKHDYIDGFKNILAVRFGGSEFLSDGNKLEYYSDGLNSFRYLKILLKIIPKLTTTSWKEPILLIDEPEIGLHSSFIYELVEIIKENIDKSVNLFITTHSSDLICELMKNDINTNIYRTDSKDHYSFIEKMYGEIDKNDKHRLTINEARCYFADAIVAVEGASDIQVFSNLKIKELFPKIKKIELYSMNSNNVGFKFVSPIKRKLTIPSLLIVDMDKIIKARGENYKEAIRYRINQDKEMNPLYNKEILAKEKCLFHPKNISDDKKTDRLKLGFSIRQTLKNSSFQIKDPGYYIEDPIYTKLIQDIKKYCLEYNTFPFSTTIEGALINPSNYNEVVTWMNQEKLVDAGKLNNILNEFEDDISYKTTALRLICNGKYDSIHKWDKLNTPLKSKIKDLNSKIGKKTSGWIDDWLKFYFQKNIDELEDLEEKKKVFRSHFPELYFILNRMEDLI